MRMKLLSACIVVAVGGGYSLAAHSQVKPEVLVKQRQAAMTLQGKYFGPLGGMMKGSVPYNADVVARNAGYPRRAVAGCHGTVSPRAPRARRARRCRSVLTDGAKFKQARTSSRPL